VGLQVPLLSPFLGTGGNNPRSDPDCKDRTEEREKEVALLVWMVSPFPIHSLTPCEVILHTRSVDGDQRVIPDLFVL